MSLSLSTWNYLQAYGSATDLRSALRTIRAGGFGVELWLNWSADPWLFKRPQWPQIRELCAGLPALSAHSALTQRFSLETLYEEMDLCAYLGADPLVCHPRTLGLDVGTLAARWDMQLNEEDIARIADILEQAAARSLRLSLENGPPDLLTHVLEQMADHPAHDYLGICIDTGHANMHSRLYESPAPQLIRRFRSRLIHLHLHDNHGERDEHLVPGQGTIGWPSVFEELIQSGYTGQMVFELADKEPEIAAERASRFVRAPSGEQGS